MKRYLYLLSTDAKHMERRLNQLANKGIELISLEHLFTGEFTESQRMDLSYVVIPIKSAASIPAHFDPTPYGFELVGGYNNMAVFKSLPCADLDCAGLKAQIQSNGGAAKTKALMFHSFVIQILITVCFFLLAEFVPFYQRSWYLSYSGICVHALRWGFAALLGANLILLPTYVGAWLRGLTPWIISGAVLTGILLGVLDLRQDQGVFVMLLLGIALACVLGLWKMCRGLGFGIVALCGIVLTCGLIFPHVDMEQRSGTGLRSVVEGVPVATMEDFERQEPLEGAGYSTKGTIFARVYSYTEVSAEASLNTETFRCLNGQIADWVENDLMEHGRWQEGPLEQTWVSASGKTVLIRKGTYVSVLSYSETIDTDQISRLRDVLL